MIYLLMYLTYVALGYKITRWCIDTVNEGMPLGMFLISISLAWPIVVVAIIEDFVELADIKPRK